MPLSPPGFLWLAAIVNKMPFFLPSYVLKIKPQGQKHDHPDRKSPDGDRCPHSTAAVVRIAETSPQPLINKVKKESHKKPTFMFPKIFLSMWTFFSSLGVILKTWSLCWRKKEQRTIRGMKVAERVFMTGEFGLQTTAFGRKLNPSAYAGGCKHRAKLSGFFFLG